MEEVGRWLAAAGFVIVALGAIVWIFGRIGFSESSDDLAETVTHVHPFMLIGSSFLLSVVLSAALLLMQWVGRR